ncbi:malonic semialdehyde reductase [Rouxiella badensis]|nr:malonic semialdehyde reductase [Rouxiella badensis]
MSDILTQEVLAQLFTEARTHNGWQDKPVSPELLKQAWDIAKWDSTSANASPLRVVFISGKAAKDRLVEAVSDGNKLKTASAPVTAIIAHDPKFYDQLPKLFPHADARSWFTSSEALANETAFRNGSLQAAYFIIALRSLGLDTGPMSGFDAAEVEKRFLSEKGWKVNFLVNIGYGDPAKLFERLPRLSFDEATLTL